MAERSRRKFFKTSAALSLGVSGILTSASFGTGKPPDGIPKNTVVLLQGDSITDGGRDRKVTEPNLSGGLGSGYAYLVGAGLLGRYPEARLSVYNRGISGNKVFQLADRWSNDCMSLRPSVVSILIGVNDFWHTLTNSYNGTVATYEFDFRNLIARTKSGLPGVKLIVGEPFAIKGGKAIGEGWFPAFDAYRRAAKKIAEDSGGVWIPYQTIFDEALKTAPVSYWCPDGVHPSIAGGYLMKEAWLKAFNGLFM